MTPCRDPHRRRLLGQSGAGRLGRGPALARAEPELSGGDPATTNNRMELRPRSGARGPEAADDGRPVTPTATICARASPTGSRLEGARLATADKKPVKNQDLWQRLDEPLGPHQVDWRWVKGHAGHPDNERADELAREAIRPGDRARRPPAAKPAKDPRCQGGRRTAGARAARGSPRSRWRCSSRPGSGRPRPAAS